MIPEIVPPSRALETAARSLVDAKAKPPGALGRIEDLAVRLAGIRGVLAPSADRARLLVFAGDHGLTRSGVSSYPAEVTQAMVATLVAGRASANAFAAASGADVVIVDAGVAADLPDHPNLIKAKVAHGTADASREPAMTPAQVKAAVTRGADLAAQAAADGVDVLLVGEMGIGNSASAALIMHRLAPAPLADCIGKGAGHDEAGLARKAEVLERAAARSPATDPLDVLSEFGGLEIAMMAGAILGAAAARRPVIVDGFISSAAALAAVRLAPDALDYCIFSHASAERGHRLMLQAMNARPLLELDLRLGEGTGALLALPLVRAASHLLTDVASLEDVLRGQI